MTDSVNTYVPASNDTTVSLVPGAGKVKFQDPFDKRALSLPYLRGKLSRGYLYADPADPASIRNPSGKPLGLKFLYNPTTVSVSYNVDSSRLPTYAQPKSDSGAAGTNAGDVPLIGVAGSATVSFSLILDRTYDCWKKTNTRAWRYGVRTDIQQFEQICGYSSEYPFVQPNSIYVVFGNTALRYYGFVQGFSVLYTNWTQDMRPFRAAIEGITMQVMPFGKSVDAAATSNAINNGTTNPGFSGRSETLTVAGGGGRPLT